ncbi:secondary thiamine-phosphate synthase enzyme YjbQ [Streptomyces platensis]|uniref:secondary thiamine-phosphate synthase enzyme YjbQ n=1 Tax=Streptomyces TaxID=1883 RepID=UPI002E125B4B|nr:MULTISPECIES: secondary thiamine-phosphate synthase enzyme YjbQ [Streptomyces]WSI53760.1 secondary thiamine-phosphate synthase enzyme YjbQ [Streptomyces platensis]WSX24586.1 secondary thiamine-phosphate synthase enzyme YjbQ [Streptomyces tubercidicus]WTI56340.1 secondary thiamine-phosphate synthase enzyme YjbQ [Streptomyces platensis]WUB78174.1 secondary thiamine-phosphate synthase enzyme YjbQ [Streptomyces platensis]
MATISDSRINVVSHDVLPTGSSIAVSVRFSVTIDTHEATIDLTDELRRLVAQSGVTEGTLHVYCGHTTCGLTINENDSGLDTDMKAVLARIAPHSSKHYYAHDKERNPAERAVHGERDNGHSHARAMVATHPELTIPVTASKLYLGQWQAIMMAEFDGPRTRELLVRVHRA